MAPRIRLSFFPFSSFFLLPSFFSPPTHFVTSKRSRPHVEAEYNLQGCQLPPPNSAQRRSRPPSPSSLQVSPQTPYLQDSSFALASTGGSLFAPFPSSNTLDAFHGAAVPSFHGVYDGQTWLAPGGDLVHTEAAAFDIEQFLENGDSASTGQFDFLNGT